MFVGASPGVTPATLAAPAVLGALADSLAAYLVLPRGAVAAAGAPQGVLEPRRGTLISLLVTLAPGTWDIGDPAAVGLPPARELQVVAVVAALREGLPATPAAEFGAFVASRTARAALNATLTVDQVRQARGAEGASRGKVVREWR